MKVQALSLPAQYSFSDQRKNYWQYCTVCKKPLYLKEKDFNLHKKNCITI